jgi:hypothetical protein
MKPQFTDEFRYPRGYVRSNITDIAKTWAAVRKKLGQENCLSESKVRKPIPVAGTKRRAI